MRLEIGDRLFGGLGRGGHPDQGLFVIGLLGEDLHQQVASSAAVAGLERAGRGAAPERLEYWYARDYCGD